MLLTNSVVLTSNSGVSRNWPSTSYKLLRHHWKSFFVKGNKGLTQWEMLYGRETLRVDDQKKVQALIESKYIYVSTFDTS